MVHFTALAITTTDFCSTARKRLQPSSSSESKRDSDSSEIRDEADIDDSDLLGRLLTVKTYRNK
jgi:hypothetical protein